VQLVWGQPEVPPRPCGCLPAVQNNKHKRERQHRVQAMRALLAAARRSRSLLAAGRRYESALAVQPSLVDGSPDSPYLAYSRPQAEPFNDSLIFESFPETKAPPMLPARIERPCLPSLRCRCPLAPTCPWLFCHLWDGVRVPGDFLRSTRGAACAEGACAALSAYVG